MNQKNKIMINVMLPRHRRNTNLTVLLELFFFFLIYFKTIIGGQEDKKCQVCCLSVSQSF